MQFEIYLKESSLLNVLKRLKVAKKKSKGVIGKFLEFVVWLTGIVVSLAVGFAMIDGVLTIVAQNQSLNLALGFIFKLSGYIIVITTLIGAVLAIVKKFE